MKVIGKPRRRVDGRAKVTGQTRFADDLAFPRMLFCKLLRSRHPGVKAVLTGRDYVSGRGQHFNTHGRVVLVAAGWRRYGRGVSPSGAG